MKIFLFGPPGSGKTTIGKHLSLKYSIQFHEIDRLFWDNEEKIAVNTETERSQLIENVLKSPSWILEGMYRQNWLDEVIKKSDLVFIVKQKKFISDYRTIKRTLGRMLRLEESERESSFGVIWEFLKFNHSRRYKNVHLKEFLERLEKFNKQGYFVNNLVDIYEVISKHQKQNPINVISSNEKPSP